MSFTRTSTFPWNAADQDAADRPTSETPNDPGASGIRSIGLSPFDNVESACLTDPIPDRTMTERCGTRGPSSSRRHPGAA